MAELAEAGEVESRVEVGLSRGPSGLVTDLRKSLGGWRGELEVSWHGDDCWGDECAGDEEVAEAVAEAVADAAEAIAAGSWSRAS